MMEFFDLRRYLGLPVLASEHGKDVDSLLVYMHWLMIVLFIGWMGYFVYVLVRFNSRRVARADHAGTRSHASTYIEVAVALVEAVLLIGLAVPLWTKVVQDFPNEKESIVMQITAQQFQWNSRYAGKDGKLGKQDMRLSTATNLFGIDPKDLAGKDDVVPPLNEMVVPINKPVIVQLTSLDVIHSFKVNPLRVTQDAIPGMRIPFHFKPTREGKFQIQCAQLCGNSHSSMKGYFSVVSQPEFDKWLAEKSKSGAATSFE